MGLALGFRSSGFSCLHNKVLKSGIHAELETLETLD